MSDPTDSAGPAAVGDEPLGIVLAHADALLAEYREPLGDDFEGYGNHVRRVCALVVEQRGGQLSGAERQQLVIAGVFHDLGIWLDGTFDYLAPSIGHAAAHLDAIGHPEWAPRVSRIIDLHHRLRPVRNDALVEAFRRADLCDVSLGTVHLGVKGSVWRQLRREYPIASFHRRLIALTIEQARREPRRPLPMLRW